MYGEHFGLSEDPFGVAPDPRFLYCSARHAEALAALHYGLTERRGLLVLSAEPGMGKTTLLLYLLERWRDRAETAFVLRPPETREQMIAAVLEDLGEVPCGGYAENCRLLLDRALECRRKGKRLILAFDEAQNIPTAVLEEIRLLTNLEAPGQKLIEVILAGQPELAGRLTLSMDQRVAIRAEIPRLEPDDVRRYVEHRLRKAGLKRKKLFTNRAIREVARSSGGVPRKINALCFDALSQALAEGKGKTAAPRFRWVTAAVIAFLTAGVFVSGLSRKDQATASAAVKPAPAVPPVLEAVQPKLEASPVERVEVQPGDTMRQIALRRYGRWDAEVWEYIRQSNPDIPDPGKLLAGQTVVLPAWEEETP